MCLQQPNAEASAVMSATKMCCTLCTAQLDVPCRAPAGQANEKRTTMTRARHSKRLYSDSQSCSKGKDIRLVDHSPSPLKVAVTHEMAASSSAAANMTWLAVMLRLLCESMRKRGS